jgi:hypothetical protein
MDLLCGSGGHDSDLIGLCPLKTGPIRLGESGRLGRCSPIMGHYAHLNELSRFGLTSTLVGVGVARKLLSPRVPGAEVEPAKFQ